MGKQRDFEKWYWKHPTPNYWDCWKAACEWQKNKDIEICEAASKCNIESTTVIIHVIKKQGEDD
jgi:hypothetical protein